MASAPFVNVGATERQFGLDMMRAMAALMVVLAHGMIYAAATIPALVVPGVTMATLGVEIFFVLSGFLIAPGLFAVAEGRMMASRFWLRRAWRTLPSYYIFLAINLLLVAWFARDRVPNVSYAFFSQSLITPPPSVFFAESWSLAVEEWFYLSAAVAAALSFRFGGKTGAGACAHFRLWLWVLVVLSPAARAAWSVMQGYEWDGGLRKLTFFRLDAIAIGVLMAARVRDGMSSAVVRRCVICGVALCALAMVYIGNVVGASQYLSPTVGFAAAFSGALALSATGLGAALLLPAASKLQRPQRAKLIASGVTHIALWSYALYLCHFPLLLLFDQFFPGLRAREPQALLLGMGVWWTVVFAFAALFYTQVERRFLTLRDRVMAPK